MQERVTFYFALLWPQAISEWLEFVKRQIFLEGLNAGLCLSIYNRSGISLPVLFICVVGGRVK